MKLAVMRKQHHTFTCGMLEEGDIFPIKEHNKGRSKLIVRGDVVYVNNLLFTIEESKGVVWPNSLH